MDFQALCPWNSLGKNTGVGFCFLLQEIFLTQGSNPSLLHCSQNPNCLSYQESYIGGECMRISLTLRSRKSSTKLKTHKRRGRYWWIWLQLTTQIWPSWVHLTQILFFSNKYYSATRSLVGWIPAVELRTQAPQIQRDKCKLHMDFQLRGGSEQHQHSLRVNCTSKLFN